MYAPGGFRGSELGDVEVIVAGDVLHLFHLTLPGHDLIGHASSRDGLAWTPHAPALRTGAPGEIDDDMLWTMGVVHDGARWQMLYTALRAQDSGRVQRIARATSDDLNVWRKAGLVAQAASAHYDTTAGHAPWVTFRDPKPVRVGDRWLAPVCARDLEHRGVVGLLSSTDCERWTVEPPLFGPTGHFELECPQLFSLGGHWYLLASVMEDRSQRYWIAEQPRGPFRAPADNRLGPPGHYAGRVCTWRDRAALFSMHRLPRGNRLLSPLALRAHADGRLECRAWSEWDAYVEERWKEVGGTLSAGVAPVLMQDPWIARDFRYEARVQMDCRTAGFVFGRRSRRAYWVEWTPAEHRVRLRRVGPATDEDGHPWFEDTVVCEAPCPPPGAVTLRVVDGEVEVVADGRVVLATWLPALEGRVALFAESGDLHVEAAMFTTLRSPAPKLV